LPKIEKGGKSWLRRPKLYKRVVEPHKKKMITENVHYDCIKYNSLVSSAPSPEGSFL
jgi:hypothetical protein